MFLDYVWDVNLINGSQTDKMKENEVGFMLFFYISDSANRLELVQVGFGKDADKSFNL